MVLMQPNNFNVKVVWDRDDLFKCYFHGTPVKSFKLKIYVFTVFPNYVWMNKLFSYSPFPPHYLHLQKQSSYWRKRTSVEVCGQTSFTNKIKRCYFHSVLTCLQAQWMHPLLILTVGRRKGAEESFEDGTISFLSIASIHHGFNILNTLTISAISRYVC